MKAYKLRYYLLSLRYTTDYINQIKTLKVILASCQLKRKRSMSSKFWYINRFDDYFYFILDSNPFKFLETCIDIDGVKYVYYDIAHFKQIDKLPFSIRVLLESSVRNADNFHIKETDVQTILNWVQYKGEGSVENDTEHEIPFKPARVLLQDFTGKKKIIRFNF